MQCEQSFCRSRRCDLVRLFSSSLLTFSLLQQSIQLTYYHRNSLFFAITTGVSVYYLLKFLREGVMPYQRSSPNPHHASGESAKDNAWSTEIETGHRDSVDSVDRHTERGGNQEEDEYALLNSTETDEGRHPGRPLSWGEDHRNGGYGRTPAPYADYREEGRSGVGGVDALSPGGYEEYRREAGMGSVAGSSASTSHYPDERKPSHGGSGYNFS